MIHQVGRRFVETERNAAWHELAADKVLTQLGVSAQVGLSGEDAARRRQQYGPNKLTRRRGRGPLMTFLLQFHQPLIYILIAAGVITAGLSEWVDSGVIFGVVLVNAIVGFVQEYRAARAIEALAQTMTAEATVIRDGAKQRLPAEELVPGDIVLLASGDKVPADLRLLEVRDLRVAEAALTGESLPVEKSEDPLPAQTPLADRRNLAFASALVTYGHAKGVVVATGDRTEVGRISELIQSAEDLSTPLTREIARFSHWLLYVILGLAGLTFLIGFLRGQPVVEMFHAAIALAVGAIPEGLPAAVTVVLAVGVWRMAQRNAIIRKLPAVETLGSTSVICSDKTGTLTQNEMTVQRVFAGGRFFEVSGAGYAPLGEVASAEGEDASAGESLRQCLMAGALCNDSVVVRKDGRWEVQGDPTEGALLVVARKAGLDPDALNARFPRVDTVPFESEFQYMATLHDAGEGGKRIVYLKGSAERVLERCVDVDTDSVLRTVDEMGRRGLRVLAFASKEMPPGTARIGHEDVSGGMTFLGLQGMIDPPRPEAIAAIGVCKTAGVQVKMITGDHATTAAAVAGQMGLEGATGPDGMALVLTGREIENLPEDELAQAADSAAVFARVSPEQKLRLVRALQRLGKIVAMTGDGVNDAPALKQANIGIAMGITGTDVAKDAADMVLTDDNFASIEAAVEEGRGVFDNLTKFIVWTLPTNLGEGLVILAAVLLGATLPILPVQVLWINMTTAVFLGMTLTFEPKEAGIMKRPPRNPGQSFLTRRLIGRVILVGAILLLGAFGLFELALAGGVDEPYARTVAVNVFVLVETFYLFNCRSLRRSILTGNPWGNPYAYAGAAAMIAVQLLFTYAPFMNAVFHTAPITLGAWLQVLGVAAVAAVLVEIEKAFGVFFD